MSEEHLNEQPEDKQSVPLSQTLGFGAGTFLTVGAIDLLAHLGPTGLVVGGIAAYVAAKHGHELVEQMREALPSPAPGVSRQPAKAHTPRRNGGGRSLLDRALGRFPEEEKYPAHEEAEQDAAWPPDEEDERLVTSEEHGRRRPAPNAREMIDLAQGVHIHTHDLAGKAIFVCGIRRHGKTTLGARIAEQLGKHYLPLFIPDLEGDYLSLADVLPRAVIAGHSRADGHYLAYAFAALDSSQAAYQLGYHILEVGYQVMLDLASYPVLDQAIAMQINIIRGLFHWANTHPESRVPCHVFLDEAQRYLPQTLSDSVILDRTVLATLLKCYMDIIAIGGKRGIAPVILTERFAQVNKKIMAQSEVFFLLRQTNDGDLDRCMEYVNSQTATKEQISRFQPGQGVYIASDGSQVVTQFKRRESSDKRSATPQADAAYRYASMPRPWPGAAVPSPDQAPRRVPAEEPPARQDTSTGKSVAAPQDMLEPSKITVLPVRTEQKPQPTLHDAILCWNELVEAGQNPSRNNLQNALIAKGFDCKENWARKFYEDIKELLAKDQQKALVGG